MLNVGFYFVTYSCSGWCCRAHLQLDLPTRPVRPEPLCCVGSLTVMMLPAALAVLLTLFSLIETKEKDFYTFKVVNIRGKLVSLEKYRGSVSLR